MTSAKGIPARRGARSARERPEITTQGWRSAHCRSSAAVVLAIAAAPGVLTIGASVPSKSKASRGCRSSQA
jgi:anti-sigma-K factor RskA